MCGLAGLLDFQASRLTDARGRILSMTARLHHRGPDAEGIRLFRQNLMRLPADAPAGAVRASPDFFTTSTCRDLVFHRMEHCLTLPDIAGFIADRHLAFIGMETDLRTGRRFAQRFPDERHLADLASWHAFEEEQPDTFVGMYQFWVHKPVAA